MRTFGIVLALLIAALLLPLAFTDSSPNAPVDNSLLPWTIEPVGAGGIRVFSLTLGSSTLADAIKRFGPDMQVAVIGRRDEPGSLEAFFDSVHLGPLTGKLILTAEASDAQLTAMRERALKTEYMESAMRRSTLSPEDKQAALSLPIRAIVFVPSARLDAAIVHDRFGPPAEQLVAGDKVQHFLYPERGLDIAINEKGKAMLQYVAPKNFALLRAPLLMPAQ